MTDSKKSNDDGSVKARPVRQGHDPLARGERLYNDKNTESATHYRSDDSELKAEKTNEEARAEDQRRSVEASQQASDTVNAQNKLNADDNVGTNDSPGDSVSSPATEGGEGTEGAKGANRQAAQHNAENSDLTNTESKRAARAPKGSQKQLDFSGNIGSAEQGRGCACRTA